MMLPAPQQHRTSLTTSLTSCQWQCGTSLPHNSLVASCRIEVGLGQRSALWTLLGMPIARRHPVPPPRQSQHNGTSELSARKERKPSHPRASFRHLSHLNPVIVLSEPPRTVSPGMGTKR